MAAEQLPPASIVRLSADRAVVARRDTREVRVTEFRNENSQWVKQELAGFTNGGAAASANLLSLGGETDLEWNTFVYGTAPREVSRVELQGYDGEGGQVVNGAWVIALRDKDLTPADIHWRFVDAAGNVVDSGVGTFPPIP